MLVFWGKATQSSLASQRKPNWQWLAGRTPMPWDKAETQNQPMPDQPMFSYSGPYRIVFPVARQEELWVSKEAKVM